MSNANLFTRCNDLHTCSIVVLPFLHLIVFRTNTSYNRWDEARKFWGLNINHTRDLNRMATAWYGNDSSPGSPEAPTQPAREIDPEERAYLLGQVSLFTWAFVRSMKRHLSPPDEDEEDYVAELKYRLTPEQSEAIISAAHRPNRALYDLSVAIEKLPMHFMRKNEINKNLSIFEDTLGGSERLLSSPVPLFYSRHTARFISVWLLFLPFALWSQFGDSWNHVTMIPASALISLFLFGIEELATQLEEPFTILPMQGFCDKIGANCNEIVSWAGQDLYELPEELLEESPEPKIESSLDVVEDLVVEVESGVEDELPEMKMESDVEAENDIVAVETLSEMKSSDIEMESVLVEEIKEEVEEDLEDKLPEIKSESDDEAQDDKTDLKMESDVVEETEDKVVVEDAEDMLPEMEMESVVEAEGDLTLFDETVESKNSELRMDSDLVEGSGEEVKDEVAGKQPEPEIEVKSVSEPETTKVEDMMPLERPEVKMEDDWKVASDLPRKQKSLRELVQGL